MSGNKTHRQQRRILEKRVETGNADKDFDPRPDLKRAEAGLPPDPAPPSSPAGDAGDAALRGAHQESSHNKRHGTLEEEKEDR